MSNIKYQISKDERLSGLSFALCLLSFVFCSLSFDALAASPLTGKHDNHTPIEVTSDTLEVMQEQNQAVFSGHVVAIQGDVRLKADKMTVYYDKAPENKSEDKLGKKSAKKP